MMSLQLKSELDPIAILALSISVLTLIFNFVQWRFSGFRSKIIMTGDLVTIPDDGYGRKISAHVTNLGGKKFQVTNFAFFDKRKPKGTHYLPTNPFPIRTPFSVDVGSVEAIYFHQDRLLESIDRGNFYCAVSVSYRSRPFRIKVKLSDEKK